MHVLTVVGNRPQFVKAAAVSRKLRERHRESLVHTGQHYDDDMSAVFFDELEIPAPDRELGVGSGPPGEQTGRMLAALEPVAAELQPDVVMVYGDTNSTLAGALAAAQSHVPVAHVEAGMRSFDRSMPEELNRVLADHASDLLLCSTDTAVANLEREGLGERAQLVGDLMADVLLASAELAQERSQVLTEHDLQAGEYVLVTAHRAGNVDDPKRLRRLMDLLLSLPSKALFPIHPRTRARLESAGEIQWLSRADHIEITPPLGYLDLIAAAAQARAVLTDSGGLQKEAYLLGVPCITLRDRTEWTETVDAGWNTLVDLDGAAALAALDRTPPPERPDLYGGGRAAEKVVDALSRWA